ncbi:MAG TPA: hypothetical protein VNP73_11615, partial [Actinomycetota bacterium]|nr:hypothetical protein [Actinomycetota bacterium]
LLFPYFLYRFAAAFEKPARATEIVAAALAAGVIIWTFFLPEFPQPGDPQPPQFRAYVFGILIEWVVLSTIMSVKLWRGGAGQPGVARRRMRLMAAAAGIFSLLIVVAGSAGGEQAVGMQVFNQAMALVAALSFYLGFSPPQLVRSVWRRKPLDQMRRGVTALLSAESDKEVTKGLLPHMSEIVGAQAIAFVDEDERIVDTYGTTKEMDDSIPEILGREEDIQESCVLLRFPFGSMIVWTSSYAPFFGTEEFETLVYLGTLAHLALERTRATQLKVQLAEAKFRRMQALQINDNVVQGLAVSKYAFELGDPDKGMKSLSDTLESAKAIITDLLKEVDPDQTLSPGMLVRDRAASVERSESS